MIFCYNSVGKKNHCAEYMKSKMSNIELFFYVFIEVVFNVIFDIYLS